MLPVSVQGGALLGRAGEPQLVGLAVHREQLRFRCRRARTPVPAPAGVRPGAPARGDGAPAARACRRRRARRRRRPPDGPTTAPARGAGGRRRSLLLTGSHPGRVGAAAEQQQQPGDDHRLAGTGLAGDDGQAGPEREHGVVDDAQAPDPQLFQHVGNASPPLDAIIRSKFDAAVAEAGHRQLELGDQTVGEAPVRQPRDPDRHGSAANHHPAAGRHVDRAAAVAAQHAW